MQEKNTSPAPPSAAAGTPLLGPGLTPEKNAALMVLLAGGGVIAAAEAGKCHRGTLYRWMQHDSQFLRVLRREQEKARFAARRQLITLVEDAASNVRNAIRCGDTNVSLSVLRGLGLLRNIESCESAVTAEEAEKETPDL